MSAGTPLSLVILISGRGSNMSAIVRACQSGEIAARPVVVADRPQAAGLARARALGVETAVLASATGGQPPFDELLGTWLAARRPDVIALAGLMRILPAALVMRYLGRMLNVHPSLLPAYRGLHTHRRVLAAGEREHGASVHFVTPELDSGPVVLQSRVAVRAGDTEASLAERVLATEHVIYPRVLGWFTARRLTWHDGVPWLDDRRLETPLVEDFRDAASL